MYHLVSPLLRFLLGTGIILALLSSTGAIAQTPTPISACGSVSGSVILTADFSGPSPCLEVNADNTTIDGNHHTISVSGGSGDDVWVVSNTSRTNLRVQNLISNAGVYLGSSANNATIELSDLHKINVAGSDDVTIDHNTINLVAVYSGGGNPSYRTQLTNNTISGDGSTLIDFNGDDGTACPPLTQYVVTDNTITSSYQCGGGGQPSCNEPKVLFMRCASGNTVSRNMVRSTGTAMPVRLRDAFDDSTVSENTFWASGDLSPDGAFGALNITSGNVGKHYPRNNIFTNNVIRSDQNNGIWIHASGPGNNFSQNIVVANSGNDAVNLGGAADGNTFNHNTIVNLGSGTVVQFAYRTTSIANGFTNNIFSGSGSMYAFDCTAQQCSTALYQADYNLFHDSNSAATFGIYGASLSALKSYVSPDDSHSIEGTPQFTNSANRDFSLQVGSPALNAASDGTNIGAWQSSSCAEDWLTVPCGAWSACVNGTQSRTCTDNNHCGTIVNRPPLSQSCLVPDTAPPAHVSDLVAT